MAFKTVICVLLAALLVGSLAIACFGSTSAQTIPKPSVPEFTVNLIDSSYDIPTSTSIDPYTGKTVTHEGSHVEARTIEIRIKNEPFTPFQVTEGTSNWTVGFSYSIRWKGSYESEWREIYSPSNGFLDREDGTETVYSNQGEFSSIAGLKMTTQSMYLTFPVDAKIDFQVQAMIGYTHRVVEGGMAPWYFFGETSGWSNTKTLSIPASLVSISSATSTAQSVDNPIFSNLSWVAVATYAVLCFAIALLVVIIASLRRKNRVLERRLTT